MKKNILSILLSLSILIMCGCQNHSAVNTDGDLSDNNTAIISDDMWNIDAEKIDLPEEYYDYGKIQIYNDSLYMSAKKCTKESDYYYKVFNSENGDAWDIKNEYSIIDSIVSCGNSLFTLEYSDINYDEGFIYRYNNGICDKKISASGSKICSSGDYLIVYGFDIMCIYDTELNEKIHLSLDNYREHISGCPYVCVDDSLNSYLVSYDKEKNAYTLIKVNSDGFLEYVSNDFNDLAASCTGEITGFFINNNKLYLSSETQKDNSVQQYMNVIDSQTGKTEDRTDIENAYFIRSGGSKYDLTYCTENSIYGFNLNSNQSVCLHTNPDGLSYQDSWDINDSGLIVYEMNCDDEFSSYRNIILRLDDEYNIVSRFPSDCQYFSSQEKGIYFITKEASDNNILNINSSQDGINYEKWWQTEIPGNMGVSSFHITEKNVLLLCGDDFRTILYNYDFEGNLLGEIEYPYQGTSIITVRENIPYVIYEMQNNIYAAEINVFENNIENERLIASDSSGYIFLEQQATSGTEVIFYDTQKNVICIYNEDVGDFDVCLDMSDVSACQIFDVIKMPDNDFFITGCDYNGIVSLWKTIKTEFNDTDIKISGYNIPDFYKEAAKKYEEYNSGVSFFFEDYSRYDENGSFGIDRLNEDIVSGNAPDIIITDGSFNFNEYAQKGLFYDLNSDLFSNRTISETDYYDFAFRYSDDELLQVIPMALKTYAFTMERGLNDKNISDINSLIDYCASNNIRAFSPEELEKIIINFFICDSIDYREKTVVFEMENLCVLLKSLKTQHFADRKENINENAALIEFPFYNIANYTEENDRDFITIGVRNDECFMGISELRGISVSRSSKSREKAVEFIKYLLSDEIQSTLHIDEWCIPANKNVFYKDLKNALNYEYQNSAETAGEKFEMIKKCIDSKMIFDVSGSTVYDIIVNEIHEYYGNNNSEEQTAERILKKLQIYFSEID